MKVFIFEWTIIVNQLWSKPASSEVNRCITATEQADRVSLASAYKTPNIPLPVAMVTVVTSLIGWSCSYIFNETFFLKKRKKMMELRARFFLSELNGFTFGSVCGSNTR